MDLQVTVFAVGVGRRIRDSELTAIASTPKSNHVYYLASFKDITSFAKQIMTGACKGDTVRDGSFNTFSLQWEL